MSICFAYHISRLLADGDDFRHDSVMADHARQDLWALARERGAVIPTMYDISAKVLPLPEMKYLIFNDTLMWRHHIWTLRPMSHSPPPPSPTQTFHPSILPLALPTPALVDSVAGAAHYSGASVEPESSTWSGVRRRSTSSSQHIHHGSHTELAAGHQDVLDDLNDLYRCRPSVEMLRRRWRPDAVYEVC